MTFAESETSVFLQWHRLGKPIKYVIRNLNIEGVLGILVGISWFSKGKKYTVLRGYVNTTL